MRILNLAKKQNSDIDYEIVHYPDGHKHFKLKSGLNWKPCSEIVVKSRFNNMDDLFVIFQAFEVLYDVCPGVEITLEIPYLFSARCDRKFSRFEAFDLEIVTFMLNHLKAKKIVTMDPHSLVAYGAIQRLEGILLHEIFISWVCSQMSVELDTGRLIILSPDAGYAAKSQKIGQSWLVTVAFAVKSRETDTGKIIRTILPDIDFTDNIVMIFDDIIDGGRTFIPLAEELRMRNADKIYLAASHGIFSNGYNELTANFDGIFTTNSVKEIDDNRIKVMDVYK